MILTHSVRVCLAVEPCDMRKGFEGLATLVAGQLKEEPTSGKLYVFTNRTRDRVKMLYWDGSGLWVLSKRLERGRFNWPRGLEQNNGKLIIRPEALEMLLSGVDLKDGFKRAWYEIPAGA
jgi:transposase